MRGGPRLIMTIDTRLNTESARRQIINRHLYRDHGEMAIRGETLAERYARHRRLHDEKECDHDHEDFDDLSAEYGSYFQPRPLRVRTDRPPKEWTLTWHLAKEHNERIPGDDLVKLIFHERLHEAGGGWAGDPLHCHADLEDPRETEYQK